MYTICTVMDTLSINYDNRNDNMHTVTAITVHSHLTVNYTVTVTGIPHLHNKTLKNGKSNGSYCGNSTVLYHPPVKCHITVAFFSKE